MARRSTVLIRGPTQQAFLEAHAGAFAYFGGRVRDPPLRQSHECSPQNPARIPTRGDDAVPRVSLPLALRRAVLHAGGRPREGRRGRRGGLLPAESLGAAAPGRGPRRAECAVAGRVSRRRGARDPRADADGRRGGDDRARVPPAPGDRAVRPPGSQLPEGRRGAVRAREDQSVLGAGGGRDLRRSEAGVGSR